MESGFTEFLQQLPPILPIALCGSGLLLIALIIVIVNARVRRARAAFAAPMPMATPAAMSDLPDLDLLLAPHPTSTATVLVGAAPVVAPAPATPPPVIAADPVSSPSAPAPVADTPLRRPTTFTVDFSDGRSVEAAEVLSIARDIAGGGLIIQIGDHAYRNAAEIENEAARRRFNSTIRELARQAMAADKQNGSVAAAPATPARSPYAPPARAGAMPGDLPKFNTEDSPLLAPRKRNQPPPPPVPELNIADAIETYLQFKLSQTPEYAGRSVHVHAAPGGGVAIEVDGQFYETVSEVDDVGVRSFLASTIEEWQSRQ